MAPRILLTHPPAARENYYPEAALTALRACGEVILNPSETVLADDRLIELAGGCTFVVADRQTRFDERIFDALPSLVAVLRCAMDISTIDVEAASRNGVLVTRASAGFVDAVAELALGFMIDLARGITRSTQSYRRGLRPAVEPGLQLSASRVGIIGYGAIGQRLATLCRAIGMAVLVYDPVQHVEAGGVRQVTLKTLLAEATFVVLLAPARPETRGLMSREAFAAMTCGSFFLNLSRGSLVDEEALGDALDRNHLAGAALDVGSAADEMPPSSLASRPDVIATPHVGGLTPQATAHQALETARQARALVDGHIPDGAVNAASALRLQRLGVSVSGIQAGHL